jgi:L-serine dehydratase
VLNLLGRRQIAFAERKHLHFLTKPLPFHANGLHFVAVDDEGSELLSRTYYSVGGGFVVSEEVAADGSAQKRIAPDTTILPLPFHSGDELLESAVNMSIAR